MKQAIQNPPRARAPRYDFHHIALSVTNRERSVEFYRNFGFAPFWEWAADDGSITITHLRSGNIILELFCYADFVAAPRTIFSTKTDLPVVGTKHFGLRVVSIEQARRDLASKGLVAPDIAITQGRTGPRYFFVADPDGILVEISEDLRLEPSTPARPAPTAGQK